MNDLKIQVALDAIDRITAPFEHALASSKRLQAGLSQTRQELRKIEDAQRIVQSINNQQAALKELGAEYGIAQAKVKKLTESFAQAGPPTEKQAKELAKAEAAAEKLHKRYKDLSIDIGAQKAKLERSVAGTHDLEAATKKLADAQIKAKAAVTAETAALEKQAAAVKRLKAIGDMHARVQGAAQSMRSAGTQAVITGGLMAASLSAPIKAFAEAEDAATQLKVSMMGAGGQVQAEFEQVNQLATKLGNKLPGTTADFQNMMTALQRNGISAKSVLSGVGESAAYLAVSLKMPTEEAAVFAAKMKGALKATDGEMMAVMDTIQKGFNLGVSSDAMLAGYSKMTPALRTLRMEGDQAAKALAPLLVQANKMGMAGESAGNAFQKVIRLAVDASSNAKGVDASKAAGISALNFNDSKGNFSGLENAYKELEKLKGLSDAARSEVLSAYFGNDAETMQALSIMIDGGLDGYQKVQADMANQADLQKRVNEQLGTLANIWDAAQGTLMNALAGFGEAMGPDLKALADKMGKLSEATGRWLKDHPTLAKWIGRSALAVVGLSAAFGAAALAASVILSPFARVMQAYKLFSALKTGGTLAKFGGTLAKLGGWLSKAGAAFAKFGGIAGRALLSVGRALFMAGRMMLTNPIILIVTGIAVAAYLIYKYWDRIAPFMKKVWDAASNYASAAWTSIKNAVSNGIKNVINAIMNNPIVKFYIKVWSAVISYMSGLASRFVSIGAGIISGLWNGLKSKWDAVKGWLMDAAASLPDGVKSVLGINSPSRVFMGIGGGVMTGLHKGMDKLSHLAPQKVREVAHSMSRAANAMNTGLRLPALAGGVGGAGSGGGRAGTALPPIPRLQPSRAAQGAGGAQTNNFGNIVINAQPHHNAQDIAQLVAAELAKRERAAATAARSRMYHTD